MENQVRAEALKRLSYIEGHLAGVRKMIEEDKYCVDVLKQSYAVRKALEKVESLLLATHMESCVIPGVKGGQEQQMVAELLELYTLANK
jgi:DNA-binding FrmR family transcriptional regulator